jgi:hypothetical protein
MKNIMFALISIFILSTFPVDLSAYQLDRESAKILKMRRIRDGRRRVAKKKKRLIARRRKRARKLKRGPDSRFSEGGDGERAYGALGDKRSVDLIYKNDFSGSVGFSSDAMTQTVTASDGTATDGVGLTTSTLNAEAVYHYHIYPKVSLGPTVSYSSVSTSLEQTVGGETTDIVTTTWLLGVEVAYTFYDFNKKDLLPYVALRFSMGSRTQTTNQIDATTGVEEVIPSRDIKEIPRVRAGIKYKLYGGNAYLNVDAFYAIQTRSQTDETTSAVTDYSHKIVGGNAGVGMFF